MFIPVRFFIIIITVVTAVSLLCTGTLMSVVHGQEKKAWNAEVIKNDALSAPDREIRYEETLSPDWKNNWDLARELYRQQKFREALVQYEFLLAEKENIDEARWEYVTLLLHLERWRQAGEQLEKLIGNEPDKRDYRLAIARVQFETGKFESALRIYEHLYQSAPDDSSSVPVLKGLIRTLKEKQRDAEIIPYLEQLITYEPDEPELQLELATIAIEQGLLPKANKTLAHLEYSRPDDSAVLFLYAQLHEKLGNTDAAAGYWQQLVSSNHDNMEAHYQLHRYYQDKENWAMSLKHVEIMLKITPSDPALLEAAAELNLRMDRIDKALEYYDYTLVIQPTNKIILQKKKEAQLKLAEDLVVLVENNGSHQLWQDLVNVTSDRPGVYRQIANLLRLKGENEELIEVLTLICLEDPHDDKTLNELTVMLKNRGRNDELIALLDNLQKQKEGLK